MNRLRSAISWVGILTVFLLLAAIWAFFIRTSAELERAGVPAVSCAEGEVRTVQSQDIVVFYQEDSPCTSVNQKTALATRGEAEDAIEMMEGAGFPPFRRKIHIDYGVQPNWGAWVSPGTPASIRVPAEEEDRKFYLYSALASVGLREGAPGISDNRTLAQGFALYFLRNPIVVVGPQSRRFYEELRKNKSNLESRIRNCRDRQCRLSQLL